MPIDVPTRETSRLAFVCVGMNFILQLPKSKAYDAIMVISVKFRWYGMFILTTFDYTAVTYAGLFLHRVDKTGWLLLKFITDQDGKLLSNLWQGLMQSSNTKHHQSTANHAQTDWATEGLNALLHIMVRAYTSPMQDDWADHLPMVQLECNSTRNMSGYSPVKLIYAQLQDVL